MLSRLWNFIKSIRVELKWIWYDLYIGPYINPKTKDIYLGILPTVILKIYRKKEFYNYKFVSRSSISRRDLHVLNVDTKELLKCELCNHDSFVAFHHEVFDEEEEILLMKKIALSCNRCENIFVVPEIISKSLQEMEESEREKLT